MTYGGMRWQQTLFVHWLVPAELVTPRLPAGVTLDRWRGHAVASLVALDVEGPAPRRLLDTAVAPLFRYRQLNLRTYVDGPEGPGMTLLHTRVDRLTYALGARLAGMPYHLDRRLRFVVHASSLELRARGLAVAGLFAIDGSQPLVTGSLEHFAAERYRQYAALPMGRTLSVAISHQPWRSRPVRLDQPLTPAALGLPVDVGAAAAHVCEPVEVVVERVGVPAEAGADEIELAPA